MEQSTKMAQAMACAILVDCSVVRPWPKFDTDVSSHHTLLFYSVLRPFYVYSGNPYLKKKWSSYRDKAQGPFN